MTSVVGYLLLFLFVSVTFLFFHLVMGKMIRPSKPDADKLTIYECGEPAIGSAWIQFDLRFYVVALLFVIFDVEVVFFFPWALVFGKANQLAMPQVALEKRNEVAETLLLPPQLNAWAGAQPSDVTNNRAEGMIRNKAKTTAMVEPETAWQLAWIAFMDILVFFGVLLLGFAYLWKRGDLDWVRSTLAEQPAPPSTAAERVLVGVDS
ncbi:MAG TPA: NADH-quinone oxidoreductase subunit A [Gemmataceae bacterium]|jgi:NADH-quinone oxidoreductase subunit A|nr:NADH-quinone oxidoreductase subunit A [Gemmataceae bacterium]